MLYTRLAQAQPELLIVSAALLVALTLQVFCRITAGLAYLGTGSDWEQYLRILLGSAALVIDKLRP